MCVGSAVCLVIEMGLTMNYLIPEESGKPYFFFSSLLSQAQGFVF